MKDMLSYEFGDIIVYLEAKDDFSAYFVRVFNKKYSRTQREKFQSKDLAYQRYQEVVDSTY